MYNPANPIFFICFSWTCFPDIKILGPLQEYLPELVGRTSPEVV